MTTTSLPIEIANNFYALAPFMGRTQLLCLRQLLKETTEEHEHFRQIVADYRQRVDTMPKVYEQDGKGEQAIVYLHYFIGACDWFILERDTTREQLQAFGWANLGMDDCAELGYISIEEITQHGAELDLYWTPKTLAEAKKGR